MIWIDNLSSRPSPSFTYSTHIVRFPGKNYCEFVAQGTLGRPIASPAKLSISLYESRQVPVWRQFITTLSTEPISEVSARTPLGVIVVPPITATLKPSGSGSPPAPR